MAVRDGVFVGVRVFVNVFVGVLVRVGVGVGGVLSTAPLSAWGP